MIKHRPAECGLTSDCFWQSVAAWSAVLTESDEDDAGTSESGPWTGLRSRLEALLADDELSLSVAVGPASSVCRGVGPAASDDSIGSRCIRLL